MHIVQFIHVNEAAMNDLSTEVRAQRRVASFPLNLDFYKATWGKARRGARRYAIVTIVHAIYRAHSA